MTYDAEKVAREIAEAACDRMYGEDGQPATALQTEGYALSVIQQESKPALSAAYREGQRDMREEAALLIDRRWQGDPVTADNAADEIRALPLAGEDTMGLPANPDDYVDPEEEG